MKLLRVFAGPHGVCVTLAQFINHQICPDSRVFFLLKKGLDLCACSRSPVFLRATTCCLFKNSFHFHAAQHYISFWPLKLKCVFCAAGGASILLANRRHLIQFYVLALRWWYCGKILSSGWKMVKYAQLN